MLPDLGLGPDEIERVRDLVETQIRQRLGDIDPDSLPPVERIESEISTELDRGPRSDPGRLAGAVGEAVARAIQGGGG